MYIAYNGRTMKAEEAIELWRKEGLSEREIKLRKFLMSLVVRKNSVQWSSTQCNIVTF